MRIFLKLLTFLIRFRKTICALIDMLTSTNSDHNCVLGNNIIKCFGRNSHGELGYEDVNNRGDIISETGNNLLNVNLPFTPKTIYSS